MKGLRTWSDQEGWHYLEMYILDQKRKKSSSVTRNREQHASEQIQPSREEKSSYSEQYKMGEICALQHGAISHVAISF